MVSLSGLWSRCLAPGRTRLLFISVRVLPLLLLLLLTPFSSAETCFPHPAPCHILARIGHTVRLGALLPTRQPARIQNALNRALASIRHQSSGTDSTTASAQPAPLLPYNLTLEMVVRSPAGWDPESLSHSACQDLVIRGVTAVLAFPRSREELIQVEFLSSFLEIPFVSILEDTEPLVTKVRSVPAAYCKHRGNCASFAPKKKATTHAETFLPPPPLTTTTIKLVPYNWDDTQQRICLILSLVAGILSLSCCKNQPDIQG